MQSEGYSLGIMGEESITRSEPDGMWLRYRKAILKHKSPSSIKKIPLKCNSCALHSLLLNTRITQMTETLIMSLRCRLDAWANRQSRWNGRWERETRTEWKMSRTHSSRKTGTRISICHCQPQNRNSLSLPLLIHPFFYMAYTTCRHIAIEIDS